MARDQLYHLSAYSYQSCKQSVSVGGIPLTGFASLGDALDAIHPQDRAARGIAFSINSEIVVRHHKSASFRSVVKRAHLCYADGAPIVWIMQNRGVTGVRIAGCDLWLELMRRCANYGTSVYLLGAAPDVMAETKRRLTQELGVKVVGCQDGFNFNLQDVIGDLQRLRPAVVSVALGAPRQEILIDQLEQAWPDALYMGIGGTFDLYSGKVKRAPLWMQKNGFEWLFRLLQAPSRIIRYRSLLQFVWYYLSRKL